MSLNTGYSRDAWELIYRQMLKEGKPKDQAAAIAYETVKRNYFKRYPHGACPDWMVKKGQSRLNPKKRKPRGKNPLITTALSAVASGHYLAGQMRRKNPSARNFVIEIGEWCGQNNLSLDIFEKMVTLFLSSPQSYDGGEMYDLYAEATGDKRGKNPVPPSKHVQMRDAADLYKRFTGHDALDEVSIDKPVLPDVMLVVGDIDGVMYTTVRDGVEEKYVHQFKKKCRPLFCVSHDGKTLYMLGGSYDFTERGIVDRT